MAREPAARSEQAAYRVLLVDDSDAYRRALSLALSRDKSIQIVGEAADGRSALEQHARLHPDIVIMDVMMPRMDGIETAHALLRSSSTAILLLSIIVRYPEHRSALDKLPLGSVDLMDKPVLVGPAGEANTAALIRRIKTAVQSRARREEDRQRAGAQQPPTSCQLIAIAASTGGMAATRRVLENLPPDFPPVVIAQHVDAEFANRFAAQLQSMLRREVTAVQEATPLLSGHLYVAAHHHHIQVRYGLVDCRPAAAGELAPNADHLFFSVAQTYGESAVGAVLTGMGHDGALGLKAIRDAGGWTIAQDDSSALVYGMPRAAVEVGACREVLTLERIADRFSQLHAQLHADPRPSSRSLK